MDSLLYPIALRAHKASGFRTTPRTDSLLVKNIYCCSANCLLCCARGFMEHSKWIPCASAPERTSSGFRAPPRQNGLRVDSARADFPRTSVWIPRTFVWIPCPSRTFVWISYSPACTKQVSGFRTPPRQGGLRVDSARASADSSHVHAQSGL